MDNIKTLLPLERPRERLQLHGPQALSDAELLAVIFGSGLPGLPVSTICNNLLEQVPLKKLPMADLRQLRATKGIGEAKALVLLALVELSRRLKPPPVLHLAQPAAIATYCQPLLDQAEGRCYFLLLLTAGQELLAFSELGPALPALDRIITLAGESGARRIQLVRNGRPKTNRAECRFLRHLQLACQAIGTEVHELLVLNGQPPQ